MKISLHCITHSDSTVSSWICHVRSFEPGIGNWDSFLACLLACQALDVQDEGKGVVLDQFGNLANPWAHYKGTGPEVWKQTKGKATHFVSSMGTTGTIMGTSRFLKEQNPNVQIVGLQPKEGSAIAGIRRWPKEYLPTIFQVRTTGFAIAE